MLYDPKRRDYLVIIGLAAALVTQIVLPYLPVERLYESALPQIEVAQAQVMPTEPSKVALYKVPAQMVTLTPLSATQTPAAPAIEPPLLMTEKIDLVEKCGWVDKLAGGERTLALSQLTWNPDYAAAKVISSCNLVHGNTPKAVVLHHTGGQLSGAIARFQEIEEASAHYLVDRDGTVYQMVPEAYGAKHVNCYNRRSGCLATCPICEDGGGNLIEPYLQSVGIEIVNLGAIDETVFTGSVYVDYQMAFGHRHWEDFPPAQVDSLKALVEDICARWNIPLDAAHVIGHSLINAKSDPGPALNLFWKRYGEPARDAIWP